MNVEKLVGHTPMIKIDYEFEGKRGSIYSKLEFYNYSGSIKDRIALYIIQKELENGNLRSNQSIVEVTSGNTIYPSVLLEHFLVMMFIFLCRIG